MAKIIAFDASKSGEKRDERLRHLAQSVIKGKNSDRAFEEMVTLCEKGVYELSFRVTRSREDALDVSQETFIKLWQMLAGEGELTEIESWYSYIMKMARNCALDFLRKQSIRRHDSLLSEDEDGERKEMEVADDDISSDPVLYYERKEKIEKVREAINSLDEDHRRILILRENEGYSYKEIADILGIEMGTVKSKIFRARNLVKEYLEKRNIF